MFFAAVTFLRRNGERLSKLELQPPKHGTVVISEMDRSANSFGRNIIVANLWENFETTSKRGMGMLAEPVLLPIDQRSRDRLPGDGQGILIAGFELEIVGTVVKEHRQIWLCQPISPPG